jgi:hypothetical protein
MKSTMKSWCRAASAGEVKIAAASEPKEPSLSEVLLMVTLVFTLHLLLVCRVSNFWDVGSRWGDNSAYLQLTAIISHWHLAGGEVPHYFWGFPGTIAVVSSVFSIAPLKALVAISILGALATCVLAHRLYGGWVATAFIVVNYRWIYTSVEGGSEPLFMCLLYASFLAARSNRWNFAALLASLSTTVRPVGVLALVCFAAVLAKRKSFRQLAAITLIGLGIGAIYFVPLAIIVGSPLYNFIAYKEDWGHRGWPLTYPFGALVPSFLASLHYLRWPNLIFTAVWVIVALAGGVAVWLPRNRTRFSADQPEVLFTTIYVLFFVSYNYFDVAGDFPRFLIPAVPLLVFSLRDWIPHDRRVLWAAAVLSALLASAAQVGFKNVFGFRLP